MGMVDPEAEGHNGTVYDLALDTTDRWPINDTAGRAVTIVSAWSGAATIYVME